MKISCRSSDYNHTALEKSSIYSLLEYSSWSVSHTQLFFFFPVIMPKVVAQRWARGSPWLADWLNQTRYRVHPCPEAATSVDKHRFKLVQQFRTEPRRDQQLWLSASSSSLLNCLPVFWFILVEVAGARSSSSLLLIYLPRLRLPPCPRRTLSPCVWTVVPASQTSKTHP
jgi:hypothetical protein